MNRDKAGAASSDDDDTEALQPTPNRNKNGSKADDANAQTQPINANGEIHGRLLGENGKPVEGATIACGAIINDSGRGGGANSLTNAEGRYRLTVPSPGIYNVWLKEHPDKRMTAAADDGLFVEGGKITNSELTLIVGTRITGTLVTGDGKPVPGVTVYCYSAARPQSTATVHLVKTDDHGVFTFSLPPGRAYIYLEREQAGVVNDVARSDLTAETHLVVPRPSDVPPDQPPLKLVLKPKESKFGGDAWLKNSTPGTQIVQHANSAGVTGTVVDANGRPIGGAMVFRYDGPLVPTNDKGEFTVTADKGTSFILYATHFGHHVWSGTPTAGDVLKIVMEKKIGSRRDPSAARVRLIDDVTLTADKPGTVVSYKVVVGEQVKAGDVLAIIKTTENSKNVELTAPFSGEITNVFVREGDLVKPSQQVLQLTNFERVKVEAKWSLAELNAKQFTATIEVPLDPENKRMLHIPGEVTFIDPQPDADGLHRVWIEVKNLKHEGQWLLADGQSVKLTIQARGERGPLSRVVSIRVGQREAKDVLAEIARQVELKLKLDFPDNDERHFRPLLVESEREVHGPLEFVLKQVLYTHMSFEVDGTTLRIAPRTTIQPGKMEADRIDLAKLAESVGPTLKTLRLSGMRVTDDDLRHLDKFPLLEDLDLSATAIHDVGLEYVAKHERITTLRLGDFITDDGLKRLAKPRSILTLAMYHPRITDAAAESLVAMPQLESLTIQWSRFGDAGLKRLATADRLKHLSLESSPFTNAGAEAFASCEKLKELGLLSYGLTAECLKPFERMTWLTELSVSYPGARRDDFPSLRTALPKTELRHHDYSPDTRPGFRACDGHVIDAESGQPVEHFVSQFGRPDRVTGEIQWEAPRTPHSLSVTGRFGVSGLQPDRKFRLIADGYEPVEITALMSNEPGTKNDQMIIRMRRITKK